MNYEEIRAKWKQIEPQIIQGIKDGIYSDSYEDIVKNLAKLILEDDFDEDRFITIDWGDYQGTKIFIFASNSYQPEESETYIVSNYYGSCSGCDQLLGIVYPGDKPEDENTINDLLSLVRDIYERIRPSKISQKDYELFMENDVAFALKYGKDMDFLKRNKAEFS